MAFVTAWLTHVLLIYMKKCAFVMVNVNCQAGGLLRGNFNVAIFSKQSKFDKCQTSCDAVVSTELYPFMPLSLMVTAAVNIAYLKFLWSYLIKLKLCMNVNFSD